MYGFNGKKINSFSLNLLTNSLFKSSKIVQNDVLKNKRKKLEYETAIFNNDIKLLFDKYYKDKEDILKNENNKLISELRNKNILINKTNKTVKKINQL